MISRSFLPRGSLIDLGFEPEQDIGVPADFGAIGLLPVDIKVAMPFLNAFAHKYDAALLVATPSHVPYRLQDRS
jgi:hypothetical protein